MGRSNRVIKKILFFMVWIISTFILFVFTYWLMGAVPEMEEGIGYFTRLANVLQDPFANYFNNYTPIGLILAFIMTELIFGIIFISKMIMNPEPVQTESNDEDIAEWSTLKPVVSEEKEIEFVDLQQEEETDINKTLQELSKIDKREKGVIDKGKKDDEESEVFLQEDMFLKLFNFGYTMPQINAMMELTTYISDIDVQQLTKMFSPSMDEDEIRGYIETFFG